MKTQWMAVCLTAVFALSGSATVAQDRQNNQDRYDRGGQQKGKNQNQADRNRDDHKFFNDNDRQAGRDWYEGHPKHTERGFRDRDRLTPEYESQLREGTILSRDLRRRSYAVPSDLQRRLAPAPRGYRYMVVGGHVVLVDNGYRVQDVLTFQLHF